MTFRVEHPHTLTGDEVRERLSALGDYLSVHHGIAISWTSTDAATVRGTYLAVNIEATVRVEEQAIVFEGKDPGPMWRERTRDYLVAKFAWYLHPSRPLEQLARA